MRNANVKKVTVTGLLFALAMVLSFVESTLTPLLGMPPGVRLGLANVVVMFALYCLSAPYALALVLLKAFLGLLTRGATAGLLSLCGGVLSFLVMLLLIRFMGRKPEFIVSASGAIAHNIGQLIALKLVFTQSAYTFYYLPVLLLSGLVMGFLNYLLCKNLLPAIQRLNIIDNFYK